jgi:hypothetical protein
MINLNNFIKYLFYFFALIIGSIIYIIYHTVCEPLEGIDNNKIILSGEIDIQKYKKAYCNTDGNGLFISMGFNIDNSGSIVRKGHPYLYNGGQGAWGYIWDPERNNNILECGYKYDVGTSGCFNKENQPDKCDCNDESHKNLFKIGDFCMISGDQNSTCIKDFLNSDRDGYKDEYNEFIYLRNLPGETISERFQNIPSDKKPVALINIVNYNTYQDLNIFHGDTNILLANYDNKEKELYLYDVTTVKNYEEYIKTHRYYNESDMIYYNSETENSIKFLENAKAIINDTDNTDDKDKCMNKFETVLSAYNHSIFQVFSVFGINSFNEYIDVYLEDKFIQNLIDLCDKKVNNTRVPINYIDAIITNINTNKKNLNDYVEQTKMNISCE